jgi:hypothetical protein
MEAHQVKRQVGDANEWSVGCLTRLGIWEAAQRHSNAGREYHFVTMAPFRPLQELTDRVRNSNDYPSFIRGSLPTGLNRRFTQIVVLYGSPEITYAILKRLYVHLVDESDRQHGNVVVADLLLEGGAGRQANACLGELVADSFDVELTADRILEALRPYELRRRLAIGRQG